MTGTVWDSFRNGAFDIFYVWNCGDRGAGGHITDRGKLLAMEQKDLCVYKTLGFTSARLRFSFAVRFGIVSLAGAIMGTGFSALLTDTLVAALLRMFGISNFSSHMALSNTLLPAVAVIGFSVLFSWIVSAKINRYRVVELIAE